MAGVARSPREVDMQVNPYLSFDGQCEAAFTFYERCLGGQLGPIFRYGGTSLANQVPADWQDKVMHGSLTIGALVFMGGDVAPDRYEAPKGFSLSIQIKDTAQAERIFRELGKDGRIVVPLEKTFWAERFGMVVDRFGTPWMINCEGSDEGAHAERSARGQRVNQPLSQPAARTRFDDSQASTWHGASIANLRLVDSLKSDRSD
jgi:PhnB protein